MLNMDGFEVCMKIREEQKMFIIMLFVKSMDIDKIMGLSIGVDDYVIKLFNFFEFVVWVKFQFCRYYMFNEGWEYKEYEWVIDDLVINMDIYEVWVDEQFVCLILWEFVVLELFVCY